ncbi:hypothetical protein B2J86_02900 [Acidovorax sp. SRB_14]|nr:hypothetical protein [Acidovorax sp. SRB_14]
MRRVRVLRHRTLAWQAHRGTAEGIHCRFQGPLQALQVASEHRGSDLQAAPWKIERMGLLSRFR